MTVRFAPALVAACVLASPLAAQELQGREGTRFTWSERVPAGQWLRIYGNNGRIQVTEATGDEARLRDQFRTLRACYDQCLAAGLAVDTLSMGMSADLEIAIAEGATQVRIGTAIFGARDVNGGR